MQQIAESYLCAFRIGCLASSYAAAALLLLVARIESENFLRKCLTRLQISVYSRLYIQVGLDSAAHLTRSGRQVWDDTLAIEVMSRRQ
jgi:hypothetical protein